MPHSLTDRLQAAEMANRRDNMSGVGSLPTSSLQKTTLLEQLQHEIEQPLLSSTTYQPAPKFTEDGEVKAWVGKFKTEHVFPVNAGANSVGGLPISKLFNELHYGNEGQTSG